MNKGYIKTGLADYKVGIFYHGTSKKWKLWIQRDNDKARIIGGWVHRKNAVSAVDRWVKVIDEIVYNALD